MKTKKVVKSDEKVEIINEFCRLANRKISQLEQTQDALVVRRAEEQLQQLKEDRTEAGRGAHGDYTGAHESTREHGERGPEVTFQSSHSSLSAVSSFLRAAPLHFSSSALSECELYY